MGQIITAGIYFCFEATPEERDEYTDDFLNCYEVTSECGNHYKIKEDFFLKHYKGFLEEFNDFIEIGRQIQDPFDKAIPIAEIPDFKTMEEFNNYWSENSRNAKIPFISEDYRYFSPEIGVRSIEQWAFFQRSGEAILETYNTLSHFEKAVQAAIKNPLGKLIEWEYISFGMGRISF